MDEPQLSENARGLTLKIQETDDPHDVPKGLGVLSIAERDQGRADRCPNISNRPIKQKMGPQNRLLIH